MEKSVHRTKTDTDYYEKVFNCNPSKFFDKIEDFPISLTNFTLKIHH